MVELRLCEWCAAHPADARALRYLANARKDRALLKKAATMGDAWAMAGIFSSSSSADEKFQLAWSSAEKGDGGGTYCLMQCFRDGIGCEKNEIFAGELRERAVDLGSFGAYCELVNCEMKPEQRVKLRISFCGTFLCGLDGIHSDLEALFRSHTDGSSNVLLFEIGNIFAGNISVVLGGVFVRGANPRQIEMMIQAVKMYEGWWEMAREACVTWILIAKRMGFNKDARKIIAKIVWEGVGEARGNPLLGSEKKK